MLNGWSGTMTRRCLAYIFLCYLVLWHHILHFNSLLFFRLFGRRSTSGMILSGRSIWSLGFAKTQIKFVFFEIAVNSFRIISSCCKGWCHCKEGCIARRKGQRDKGACLSHWPRQNGSHLHDCDFCSLTWIIHLTCSLCSNFWFTKEKESEDVTDAAFQADAIAQKGK